MIEPSSTMLEVAEFRIFGQRFETVNKLESVSISSDQSLKNRIVPGDTIKLSFKSTEQIQDVAATIQGQAATISTTDNLNWTATLVTDSSVQTGTVKFKLNYKTAAESMRTETIFTTDGSTLFISDQTGYVSNLLEIANLSDSSGRNPADLLATASTLFDSNLGSFTDFRLNGSGYGAYLTFDFKEGGEARLSKVEVIARQDGFSGRINGTVVQGSNDNRHGQPSRMQHGIQQNGRRLRLTVQNLIVISASQMETTGLEIWLNYACMAMLKSISSSIRFP